MLILLLLIQRSRLLLSSGGDSRTEEGHGTQGICLLEAPGCSSMGTEMRHRNSLLLELSVCHKGTYLIEREFNLI